MIERLSPEDARILALESHSIVGHTCKVLIADGDGRTVERLRAQIERRLGAAPRLRSRLAPPPFGVGCPLWVDDPDFDVDRHVRAVSTSGPVTRERLLELVAGLMAERLPRDRPLWAIDVVEPLEDGGAAAIWRIHHALADGQAVMATGAAVLWSRSPALRDPEPAPPAERVPGSVALLTTSLADRAQEVAAAASRIGLGLLSQEHWRRSMDELRRAPATIARELRPGGASPLDLQIGRTRRISLVDHELDAVRGAAHALGDGVTVNDVLLSLVAGGLRRWLAARHGPLAPVRVQVPVSMHRPGELPGAVPNRDSFLNVSLPIEEEDPVRRLMKISDQTQARKAGHDADELYALFADVADVSRGLFRLAHRLASSPHVFALSISNVRGPAGELYLAGKRIREAYSLAEIAPHHALRVGAISFGSRISLGLCADADAVPDLDVLADGVREAIDELCGAVESGAVSSRRES